MKKTYEYFANKPISKNGSDNKHKQNASSEMPKSKDILRKDNKDSASMSSI